MGDYQDSGRNDSNNATDAQDIPFTHRCSALLYVDNTIEVDDEDVANIEFPKQRFARPVRTGIFVFGMAEEDDADTTMQAEVSPDVPIPGLRTGVRFPGLPPNILEKFRHQLLGCM